ncbi:hypothetical protein [Kitasatospora sp. NPDC101183]|uniref:hypothetical protein n=1 Tax=Kitasatospora sp. NPDC101183 TaxID=3364100 RepID=UPI00382A9CDE
MDELTLPAQGMTISVRHRQDVVVADPERLLAAARAAFRELHPDIPDADVPAHVADVHDAVFALLERFGRLADGTDGLSPAGDRVEVVLDVDRPLQDYGCFGPA